ncbi:MAG: sugar phosphate isomerase/epimerase [Promethearchaeota archaeon]|nr:MAG: sugar phosphate isomerase/epimerase [Candidatus Lokiarchaeota archaeon]
MILGISSLGHLIEFASRKFQDYFTIVFNATEKCLNFVEEHDLNLVELVIEPESIIVDGNKWKFIDLVNSYSFQKQVHGPFIDISLCSHNDTISQASIEAYINTYHICKEINANIMTIHPGIANSTMQSMRNYNKKQLSKAITKILQTINDSNFTLCLENMPQTAHIMLDQDDIKDTLTFINRNDLFITFDTSHFYTNRGNVGILWERFHDIIKNVHLVENFSRKSDTHPMLGSGKIQFSKIFQEMKNFSYNGPLIIELASSDDLLQSVDFISKFL